MDGSNARMSFPERHGPTVLLAMGVVLSLGAVAAPVLGNAWGQGLAPIGFVSAVMGALLSKMEGEFQVLTLRGTIDAVRRRGTRRACP